jgi:hypothetical protein
MFTTIFNTLFGCSHRRTTFPLTPARHAGFTSASTVTRHGTYVVCLDCGKELSYDWENMRVGEPVMARVRATTSESFSTVNR